MDFSQESTLKLSFPFPEHVIDVTVLALIFKNNIAFLWIAGKRKILRTLLQVPHEFETSFKLFFPEPTLVAHDPFLETLLDALWCALTSTGT